jgi:hypothetical protein
METSYTASQVSDRSEITGWKIEYVLATDYAALEAERDEWKRRCEKIVSSLKPDGPPVPGGMFDKEVRVLWRAGINLHDRAIAIAEGRDNG